MPAPRSARNCRRKPSGWGGTRRAPHPSEGGVRRRQGPTETIPRARPPRRRSSKSEWPGSRARRVDAGQVRGDVQPGGLVDRRDRLVGELAGRAAGAVGDGDELGPSGASALTVSHSLNDASRDLGGKKLEGNGRAGHGRLLGHPALWQAGGCETNLNNSSSKTMRHPPNAHPNFAQPANDPRRSHGRPAGIWRGAGRDAQHSRQIPPSATRSIRVWNDQAGVELFLGRRVEPASRLRQPEMKDAPAGRNPCWPELAPARGRVRGNPRRAATRGRVAHSAIECPRLLRPGSFPCSRSFARPGPRSTWTFARVSPSEAGFRHWGEGRRRISWSRRRSTSSTKIRTQSIWRSRRY